MSKTEIQTMFGFAIGDRVEPSELGHKHFVRDGRQGTVIGFAVNQHRECVKVQWDCLITPQTVYFGLLKHIDGVQQGTSSEGRNERSERASKSLLWPKQRAKTEEAGLPFGESSTAIQRLHPKEG